ncbi:MAG TPA: Calx-beta domain-containing protein [Pyrinomonadaceae bacterium]|jgi:probable HAF family extracellular repeat protein
MRHPWKLPLAVVCLLALAFFPLLPAPRGSAQAVTYTVTDIGSLGGGQSTALGLEECGKVVGESLPTGSSSYHPYFWDGTTMIDLGTFGGLSGAATGVNGSGRVTGSAQSLTSEQHPFIWTQATGKTDIGTAGSGAAAYDINDANQVVGQWEVGPLQDRAYVWTQATGKQTFPAPWGTPIAAYGINNAGHIVGTAQTSAGASHAFLSSGGVVTDLATLGGTNSFAYDVNDSDVVVGLANIPSNNASRPFHAFRWTSAGGIKDLGTLGGALSLAYGINASGHIVGYAEVSPGVKHAFLWTDDNADGDSDAGEMKDLNTLAPPPAGWTYEEARGVNDRGQIVATGVDGSNQRHAFLLTPDNAGPSPCDIPGTLQFSAATYAVGEAGASATITVTRAVGSDGAVSVGYATSDGTAAAGSDYTAASGTLNFAAGETSKTFNVSVSDDALDEVDETVNLTLSGPAGGATLGTQTTAVLTINDNDAAPSLSTGDVTVAEGDAGTTNATFNVTLSAASAQTVTVNYATADNSATQPADYAAASGTLTFNPGDTLKTVTVAVAGDTTDEANETFFVNLSTPANATVGDGQGTGTINDDDGAPSLSVGDVTVTEGNASTTAATFTVTLLPASGQTVTVNYATADGTATALSDYTAVSNSLTFTPGQTSKTVTVNVNGDTTGEAHENFFLNLSSPSNATISDNQGQATVNNDDAALTIDDVTHAEGNAGQTAFEFTVTLSHVSVNAVSVNYATSDGTATASPTPGDYTAASSTLNIPAGSTSGKFIVQVNGDTTYESNETFNVTLSGATGGATISDNAGVGNITSDDTTPPAFSISDVTLNEGNSGTVNFDFNVTLSAPSGLASSVSYATTSAGGTATEGNDYTAKSSTLTFDPGQTSKTVTVPVNGDTIFENTETFFVNLSAPSGATVSDAQGLGTITNDEASSVIEFPLANYVVNEGETFTFTVKRTGDLSAGGVTVNYQTAFGGTATPDSDYTPVSGTLTFAPGETQKSFTLTTKLDSLDEPTEDVVLTLSSPFGATLGARDRVVLNITDVDTSPSFTINNTAVNEGNTGSTVETEFTVTLSAASGIATSVHYATADVKATAASGDYVPTSGTLNFAPGVTTQKFKVVVNGDNIFEDPESFRVNLSGATGGATVAPSDGVCIINNDEAVSAVRLSSATYTAGEAGGSVEITVVRTSGTAGGVTVHAFTQNGTAVTTQNGPNDYVSTDVTLAFAEGETSKTFNVPLVNDTLDEPDETFSVKLPTNSFKLFGAAPTPGAQDTATVTIVDNDEPPSFQFSAATYSVDENVLGGQIVIFVTRTGGTNGGVSVNYATSNGTATAGTDYTAASGTLTFGEGTAPLHFFVPITNDSSDETDETVNLTLSNPTGGATLGTQKTSVLTIKDDEGEPSLSVANLNVTEGNAGTTNADVIVTLLPASGQTVTVNYSTAGGTADVVNDYAPASGTLTFAPGETGKTIPLQIVGDTAVEPDESFHVNLSGAANAFVSKANAVVNILNDDNTPTLSFSQSNFFAEESAHFVTVTVTRIGDASVPVAADFASSDATATERKDYTAVSGTLSFAAGETSKTFDVLLTEDAFQEPNEDINLALSNPSGGAVLGVRPTATVAISANDNPPPAGNPIDDSSNFVRQHYHDFLNREPDASGLAFWTGEIEQCGADAGCREVKRINVSAAFFLSIEFQETGYLVERTYKAAYGDATSPGIPGTVPVVRLREFLPDTRRIGEGVVVNFGDWQAQLEANKNAYMLEFVQRTRFTNAYPTTQTPAQFVDALYANAGVTPETAERQAAIDEFGGAATSANAAARARALRRAAEHPALVQAEFRRAFVLMQYYGYLRRNPDDSPEPGLNFGGWNFWLGKLNEFNGDPVRAQMVKAFLDSSEYRNRFGQ